jgi:competence protein ComEC
MLASSLRIKKLVIILAAVSLTLACAGIPILEPLPQPPTSIPPDTAQPSSTFTLTHTPLTPTLTFTATATPTITITPSLTVTHTPSKTASPPPAPTSPNPLKICFFSVGLGDAILILAPDGKTMLIDGGSRDTGITGYLRSLGVRQIDAMVATHPHQDHIGGLIEVLRAFPVSRLYTNGGTDEGSIFRDFRTAVAETGVPEQKVRRGDEFSLGGLTFYVLNPPSPPLSNTNKNSMVLRFKYKKTTVLLMADADQVTEEDILEEGLSVDADIVKLGHHGSDESSSKAFLEAVSPESAIYSSGYGNSYGFPRAATLDRLRSLGIEVYGTDKLGSIFVTIGMNGYKIEWSKGE